MAEAMKIAFRPSPESNDHFIVFVSSESAWRNFKEEPKDDVPADVVDSFDIFFTDQGTQGKLGRASKQQLENAFGTKDAGEILRIILLEGEAFGKESVRSGSGTTNPSKGSSAIDTRGR